MSIENLLDSMRRSCDVFGTAYRNRFAKYRNLHMRLGLPAIVISAMVATGASALTPSDEGQTNIASPSVTGGQTNIASPSVTGQTVDLDDQGDQPFPLAWAVAGLSLVVTTLTGISTFVKPLQLSDAHSEKAAKYEVLKDEIEVSIELESATEQEANRKAISKKIQDLKIAKPRLSDRRIEITEDHLKKRASLNVGAAD